MVQVLDTIVVVLFVLFLIYIFRGYHLSRLEKESKTEQDKSSIPDSRCESTSDGDGSD